MEWDNEKSLWLISLYESYPELWQPDNHFYFNKSKKNDAWEAIAAQLDTSSDIVRAKMTSLLASFRREKSKVQASKRLGQGAEIFRSRWFAYAAFGFLRGRNKFKKTINSCRPTSENEIDLQVELIETDDENKSESASQTVEILSLPQQSKTAEIFPPPQQSKTIKSASSQTEQCFAKPTAMKRKKISASPVPQVEQVVDTLQHAARRNACDVYGELVAMKLKSYSKTTQAVVQHLFSNILFEADMGRYERVSDSYQRNQTVSPNDSAPPSPTVLSSADSGPPSPATFHN